MENALKIVTYSEGEYYVVGVPNEAESDDTLKLIPCHNYDHAISELDNMIAGKYSMQWHIATLEAAHEEAEKWGKHLPGFAEYDTDYIAVGKEYGTVSNAGHKYKLIVTEFSVAGRFICFKVECLDNVELPEFENPYTADLDDVARFIETGEWKLFDEFEDDHDNDFTDPAGGSGLHSHI
jgi:hypothetical protein